jgi:hypothetical protein
MLEGRNDSLLAVPIKSGKSVSPFYSDQQYVERVGTSGREPPNTFPSVVMPSSAAILLQVACVCLS